MTKKKMYVEYEDDGDLSESRKDPGKRSPLVRDADGNLIGHVRLSEIDDEDDDVSSYSSPDDDDGGGSELARELGELLGVLVVAILTSEQTKRWWEEHALPALRATRDSARRRLPRLRRSRRKGGESVEVVTARELGVGDVVEASPAEQSPVMSSDEAQQRLLAALAARAFSDEQLRILLGAQIGESDPGMDLRDALEQLVPAEIEQQVTSMLDANPGLLDEFTKVFWNTGLDRRALITRSDGGAIELPPAASED